MRTLMKRVLLWAVLPELLALGVWAAEPTYVFTLTAEGRSQVQAATGDIITVTLTLRRAEGGEYTMYAMQDELYYDSSFFRPVEEGEELYSGVQSTDIALRDHRRAHYLNWLSLSGGQLWPEEVPVGSFRLEVIAEQGASRVENGNCQVSLADGSGSWPVKTAGLTVTVSDSCLVVFHTGEGSAVAAQSVTQGALLPRPADPRRPGYRFGGWYQDVDCREAWDFAAHRVEVNTHLYAAWLPLGDDPGYSDVQPGDWFYEDVAYVSRMGLMDGVGGGRFAPGDSTSRAMLVTILWRMEGCPAGTGGADFADVEQNSWYTEAVRWAAGSGIVQGYSRQSFGPNDPLSREQLALILYRYAAQKGYETADRGQLSRFTDAGQVSPWAAEALSWANARGLVSGTPENRLLPQGGATRSQTAAILHRFLENLR